MTTTQATDDAVIVASTGVSPHDGPTSLLSQDNDSERKPSNSASNDSDFRGDSLIAGVSLMLVMTVFQRGIGFGRNVLVCRLMDPHELGLWNLAETTLILFAPLLVLGIPGTLSRYVEHYRQRRQLPSFLSRVTLLSIGLAIAGISILALRREWFRNLALGGTNTPYIVASVLVTLLVVIVFNFIVELLMAMRQVKAVSLVQFANSTLFTILAVSLLSSTELRAQGVVLSYGVSCMAAAILAGWLFRSALNANEFAAKSQDEFRMWTRIIPYAGWIWVTDLLDNLFNAADRYMIVHFSGLDEEAALAMVGQYHCSRILGVLLISVATMLANVLVPYLTFDWERGRHRLVHAKMNLGLKLVGLGSIFASAAVILFGPMIFDTVLAGRYTDGFRVLPCTMVYCVWVGLMTFSQSYLFCAERAGYRAAAIAIGLLTNVALNAILLPAFGLQGAVWATATANLGTLCFVLYFCRSCGLYLTNGVGLVIILTIILLLPSSWLIVGLAFSLGLMLCTKMVFSRWEKRQLKSFARKSVGKLRIAMRIS